MRMGLFILGLALLCMTGTGCSLFKKNTNNNNPTGLLGKDTQAPAKFPTVPDPLFPTPPPTFPTVPPKTGAIPGPGGSAIIAGTVMDAYHRPVGNAYVRWVYLEESDAGAPIDVAADAGGHFIIQGVKPGKYKLIARAKDGEKILAGVSLANAPNVRVVIGIKEDLAHLAPPIPGTPAYQGPSKNESTAAGTTWNAGPGAFPNRGGADANLPTTMMVPAPPADPKYPPGIAQDKKDRGLPMLKIPGKQPPPIMPAEIPPPPTFNSPPSAPNKGTAADAIDTGPTRVPSCVLVGNRLENLALRDTKGQTWEYRKQGQGKLVLLHFWSTTCMHCKPMMPTLERWHTQYGTRGLEVIGMALEEGRDEKRDAERINKVCNAMQVNYRQLMGHTQSFDVGKHFAVKGLPTLILLNESGHMIFHHKGRPEPDLLSALERTIQDRLNNRPF